MDEKFKNILVKTGELFNKFGLKSVSMDDVATENGISKKTLYKYVSDKSDLIRQSMQYEFTNVAEQMCNVLSQKYNAVEEMFAVRPVIFEVAKKYNPVVEHDLKKYYPQIFRDFMKLKAEHIYENSIKNLKKGIAEGLYRADIDVDIVAGIRVATVITRMETQESLIPDMENPAVSLQSIEYHLRAVCSTKGIKLLEQKINKLKQQK